uniref:Uncharacterized protein n=1 Tax=Ditylenchus dipsaci TaxID=166011 RepID=A0A915D3U1_9BILA
MDKIYECFEIKLSGPFDIEYQVKDGAFIKEDQIHSIKFYEISEKTDDHCEILHDLDAGRKKNVLILARLGSGNVRGSMLLLITSLLLLWLVTLFIEALLSLLVKDEAVNRKGNPLLVQTCNVEGSDENINSAKSTTGMTKPRVFETAESGRLRLIKTRGIRHTGGIEQVIRFLTVFLLLFLMCPDAVLMAEATQDRSAGQHAVVDWHKPLISNNSRSCFFITLGLVCFLGCLAVYAVNRTAKLLLVLLSVSSASFIAFGICIRLPKISDAYVYFIKALVPISMYYAAVGVHESLEDKSRTFTYVANMRAMGKELQEAKKTILTLRDDNKKLRSKMWKDYLCKRRSRPREESSDDEMELVGKQDQKQLSDKIKQLNEYPGLECDITNKDFEAITESVKDLTFLRFQQLNACNPEQILRYKGMAFLSSLLTTPLYRKNTKLFMWRSQAL